MAIMIVTSKPTIHTLWKDFLEDVPADLYQIIVINTDSKKKEP